MSKGSLAAESINTLNITLVPLEVLYKVYLRQLCVVDVRGSRHLDWSCLN